MDIKSKSLNSILITKIIAFIIVVVCFTGAITSFIGMILHEPDLEIVFQNNYFLSHKYTDNSEAILSNLTRLITEYKSEENISSGNTVNEDRIEEEKQKLFQDFQEKYLIIDDSAYEENNEQYKEFEKKYEKQISSIKNKLIDEDMRNYKELLQELKKYKGIIYYVSDGENTYSNSKESQKNFFKSQPSYMIFEGYEEEIYPREFRESNRYHWMNEASEQIKQPNNKLYIAFTDEYINSEIKEWKESRKVATESLYRILGFSIGLIASFIILILLVGRKSFKDKEVQLNSIDRLPNDANVAMCLSLIGIWAMLIEGIGSGNLDSTNVLKVIIPITAVISTFGLVLVLSLVKHFKNKTLIKNTLTYKVLYKIYRFIKDIYDSGSVGVKVIVVVVAYPLLTALTFFMFPITIGAVAWLCLIKVKEFNKIKEGIEKIKNGDMDHRIEIQGEGEFAKLSNDINSITEGLKKSVDNELKSERLKTELITNVSHDIRTPLTSIITYVDLLKNETDSNKSKEYIEILEQKSQRLKTLTDDLFEATKASSGNIPVNLEKIDMVSLLTQGLGELDDKIKDAKLDFKINHPKDKVYVTADGKLLWRVIENLLSNIFKYALKESRVYIDIEELENTVSLTMKNISAYELNISSDELMERFKRGDESRSSQGSGLGLSIAKSLIDAQGGMFNIEIDGDLFKSIIKLPIKSE